MPALTKLRSACIQGPRYFVRSLPVRRPTDASRLVNLLAARFNPQPSHNLPLSRDMISLYSSALSAIGSILAIYKPLLSVSKR